jgi:hypothetical protein
MTNTYDTNLNAAAGQSGARMKRIKDLRDPIVLFMLDYWKAKRGERRMPHPDDIDPVEFARYMPNLQLIQVDHDPFELSYRLLGEAVSNVHGGNYRSRKVKDLDQLSPKFGSMMYELFKFVALERRPYAAGGTLDAMGKGYTEFEGVYMPLSFDDERTDRILCASSYRIVAENERIGLGDIYSEPVMAILK